MYSPYTTPHFAPAPPASTSESTSRSRDLAVALSATSTWRGKHSPSTIWQKRLERESWIRRLSGQISAASQASTWIGVWTSSLPASLASHIPPPDREKAKPTLETYGPSLAGCLASYDRNTSSWRTLQASLTGPNHTLAESAETFPPTAGMRNGRLYPRPPLELPTAETDYSSSPTWPSPTARDGDHGPTQNGRQGRPGLANIARDFSRRRRTRRPLGGASSKHTHCLNPLFVENLMGFPIGWTESDFSATQWSQYRRLLHSSFSGIVSTHHEPNAAL